MQDGGHLFSTFMCQRITYWLRFTHKWVMLYDTATFCIFFSIYRVVCVQPIHSSLADRDVLVTHLITIIPKASILQLWSYVFFGYGCEVAVLWYLLCCFIWMRGKLSYFRYWWVVFDVCKRFGTLWPESGIILLSSLCRVIWMYRSYDMLVK